MQQIIWPAIALALMTAACDSGGSVRISSRSSGKDSPGVLKVVDALQCPQTQGVLTRKGSAQAEGATCIYSGPRGSEVTLQLVKLDNASVHQVLKDFETRLSASLPEAQAAVDARAAADVAQAGADAAAQAADEAARDTAHVIAGPVRVHAQDDKASVRLPGISIKADGDRADIRIGGLTIRADDKSGNVKVASPDKSVNIDATDGAARVQTSAPGEAVRATFMMTADQTSESGWRTVGYEARGPVGGPIVIATVRSKDRNDNRLFDAAKALVTLNVGD